MKNATLSLKVLRISDNKELVYRTVDSVIDEISKAGLSYLVGPSETTIDGDINELISLLGKITNIINCCHDPIFISCQFYYHKNGVVSLWEKIKGK